MTLQRDWLDKDNKMIKPPPLFSCFSLYSNMISDEGAKSLAAVLPYMASLTDLE